MLNFTELDTTERDELDVSAALLDSIIDYTVLSTDNPIVDETTRQVIMQSFLHLTGNSKEAEDLAFGDSTWRIKIAPNLLKTAAVASVMIGLLHASGATQLAAVVLPAVLPLLIDIDTVRLTVKDDIILSEMRLNEHLTIGLYKPDEIYQKLSAEIQEEISYSEFLDVLDTLCITENAHRDQKTGFFRLNDEKQFKVIFA